MIELHIKLLCESNTARNRKRVLEELKNYGRYPGSCLEMCKTHNVKEAWAFLEEIKGESEGIMRAIKIKFEIFEEYFTKCVKKNKDKPSHNQYNKLKAKLADTVRVVKTHFSTNDSLWFQLLEDLLKIDDYI
mmetsp:Transcript_6539/g.5869  ORF Transcript_6539/g.5869 Transcript_6539/m.5869 type:complete len:132 (-) Transcript_6539:697-1092(-)